MASDIYWIDHPGAFRLATMARPRAGDWLADEVGNWDRHGVDRVVSLLEPAEVADLDLHAEASLCRARGIEFLSLPIADRGIPEDLPAVTSLAREIAASRATVAIHCRIGIGRSSMIAAAVLCASGMTPEAAFSAIELARGLPVPDTASQREWVVRFHARLHGT
jgi:protein-tyrosine phosphatase